jgi:hypothetical protein
MTKLTATAHPVSDGAAADTRVGYHHSSTLIDLIALEPRILDLLQDGSRFSSLCGVCRFYLRPSDDSPIPGFKSQVMRLTGWTARTDNPTLKTLRAYDLLYGAVWRVMREPRVCRRCGAEEGGESCRKG